MLNTVKIGGSLVELKYGNGRCGSDFKMHIIKTTTTNNAVIAACRSELITIAVDKRAEKHDSLHVVSSPLV